MCPSLFFGISHRGSAEKWPWSSSAVLPAVALTDVLPGRPVARAFFLGQLDTLGLGGELHLWQGRGSRVWLDGGHLAASPCSPRALALALVAQASPVLWQAGVGFAPGSLGTSTSPVLLATACVLGLSPRAPSTCPGHPLWLSALVTGVRVSTLGGWAADVQTSSELVPGVMAALLWA